MPKTSSQRSGEGLISHFNAVRLRVNGTGFLKLTFFSYQNETYQQLSDLAMAEQTRVLPTRLANFIDQNAALQIETHSINDYFKINRIVIYRKPFASEYPS